MAKQIYGSDVFDFAKIKESIGVDAFVSINDFPFMVPVFYLWA